MDLNESLRTVLADLPEARLREVLDFAMFVRWQEERTAWRQFGQKQFARAYGPDEPEYSRSDIKYEPRTECNP